MVPSTAGGTQLPSGRWAPEVVLGRKVSPKRRADGTIAEPVAAFDVTFAPSKSVSLLWGLTESDTVRRSVVDAHEAAVAASLDYLEGVAGHTRAGDGGVRRVDGDGFVIAQFRHRTARSTDPGQRVGDPQLHSHCAILNRVRGVDGTWRTLDSKAIYRHAHAAGAIYGALLEHELSQRLGVAWQTPNTRVMMREIAGVDDALIGEFSSRRAQVLDYYDRLEAEWRQIHGRTPTKAERAVMLDEATVRSRHRKTGGTGDLHAQWRSNVDPGPLAALEAAVTTGNPHHRNEHGAVAATGSNTVNDRPPADGGRLEAGTDELTAQVFVELHQQRAWWTRAHVTSEVARLIADRTIDAIEVETERIVQLCVPLEVDNDPAYADPNSAKFTSTTIRDAEARVLDSARNDTATFTVDTVRDPKLGDDQVAAVDEIAAGNGRIATVVGPAGAGKTTMLRSVAASYETGGRDVRVLTLSAAAARVVTDETGLDADTIAGWQVGTIDIPRNGLVIVDEASMVPTLVLDELVRVADIYRTKVALLGDYAQMGAPEAGGLLRDLAAMPTAVELTAVRRFRNQWEADATLELRSRQPSIAGTYQRHGRIHEATTDTVFDHTAAAWWSDIEAGHSALIVVDTAADAAEVEQIRRQNEYLAAQEAGLVGQPPVSSRAAHRPAQPPNPAAERELALSASERKWGHLRDDLISAALQHTDEVERLLLAAQHWLPRLDAYSPTAKEPVKRATIRRTDAYLWTTAFPTIWPDINDVSLESNSPAWDSEAIGRWFVDRCQTRGRKPPDAYGGGRFLGAFPHKGWIIRRGSCVWHNGSMNGVSPPAPMEVVSSRSGEIVSGAGFGMFGLQKLAQLSDLSDQRMQLAGTKI